MDYKVIIYKIMKNNRGFIETEVIVGIVLVVLFGGLLFLVLGGFPFFTVTAGQRAVVLRLGAIDRVEAEGLHFKFPFIDQVKKVYITPQKEEAEAGAASRDLQSVRAKVAVNYNLVTEKVDILWEQFRGNETEIVIKPAIQESIKAATAKYTAEELITKRELVKSDITTSLKERLSSLNINISNVSITDFDFSAEFNKSIEQKVKAEQDALTSKNKLEQVKYEAEQTIEKARAEAESIKIQAQAINSQGGADYVQLQAISRWNGVLPASMIPNASVPFLNLK